MGSADILQAIRDKIEQRKQSLRAGICNEEVFTRKQRNEMLVATEELSRLMSFLDTLAYNELVELSSSVDNYPKNVCPPSVECEKGMREIFEDSLIPSKSGGLEVEIERYLHSIGLGYGGWVDGLEDEDLRKLARHFAQWGAEHAREQMMKDAVPFYEILKVVPPGPERDRVLLIVVKEGRL